jgi:hypothetical protein
MGGNSERLLCFTYGIPLPVRMRLCFNRQYSTCRSEPRTVFFASRQARGEPPAGFPWDRKEGERVNEKGRRLYIYRLPGTDQRRQDAVATQVYQFGGWRAPRAFGRAQHYWYSMPLPTGLGSPQLRTIPLGWCLSVFPPPPVFLAQPFPCMSFSLPSRPVSLRVPEAHSSPVRIL